jgi:hypothetical protein
MPKHARLRKGFRWGAGGGRGASRRGYLEHADGNGLVGVGDADEGLDRLPQRLRHGWRLLRRRRPRLCGDDDVGSLEESRSSEEPCVLISAVDVL